MANPLQICYNQYNNMILEVPMNINNTLRYINIGLPEDILRRKLYGDFEGAIHLIDRRLERDDQPKELRNCLIAQREMMLRTPKNYPFSKSDALALIREHIPDFTEEEFDERVDAGKISWIYINGEMRFLNRFFQTMCKAEPAFAVRAGIVAQSVESAKKGDKQDGLLDRTRKKMAACGQLSNRIRIRAGIRLKDEEFTPGMFLRVHLPIPCECDQQSEIRIEKVWPENGQISPADALQRTVCWEEYAQENHEFYVEYSYIHTAKFHDTTKIEADKIQPDFFTNEEAPHIVFTPYIRQLTESLSEGTDDPLEKARRFYDFITLNMKYSFMPNYFILENISDTCARNFTGDCGVFALLFITLCRCAGIPAQWQSGLTAEPDYIGCHDWVRFYIAPYGWLYSDPSYGTGAVRAQNEERRKFYFGNLDPYRMAANNAFQADFTIEKQHWRADPYDNQTGEIETADRGFSNAAFEHSLRLLLCEEISS